MGKATTCDVDVADSQALKEDAHEELCFVVGAARRRPNWANGVQWANGIAAKTVVRQMQDVFSC